MSKLLKVTMEFEDKIQTLEDKEAQTWLDTINGGAMMSFIHHNPFPAFNWKITLKKHDKKSK